MEKSEDTLGFREETYLGLRAFYPAASPPLLFRSALIMCQSRARMADGLLAFHARSDNDQMSDLEALSRDRLALLERPRAGAFRRRRPSHQIRHDELWEIEPDCGAGRAAGILGYFFTVSLNALNDESRIAHLDLKAFALFSLVFGIGLAIQCRSSETSPAHGHARRHRHDHPGIARKSRRGTRR